MLNVIRYSQVIGLVAVDSSTTRHLGEVEDIWADDAGRITYFSSSAGYLPLDQVSGIGELAVSTYGQLVILRPGHPLRLHALAIQSSIGEPLGKIDDFLFDWQTGQIVAYLLVGDIATPFGGRAVLYPADVREIEIDRLTIRAGGEGRLVSEFEGLDGFLSEQPQQVRQLVRILGDRLHDPIAPQDRPEAVRVKIKAVSNELAETGHHDLDALAEATQFLHDRWESLQQSISRTSHRTKAALESAWKQLINK